MSKQLSEKQLLSQEIDLILVDLDTHRNKIHELRGRIFTQVGHGNNAPLYKLLDGLKKDSASYAEWFIALVGKGVTLSLKDGKWNLSTKRKVSELAETAKASDLFDMPYWLYKAEENKSYSFDPDKEVKKLASQIAKLRAVYGNDEKIDQALILASNDAKIKGSVEKSASQARAYLGLKSSEEIEREQAAEKARTEFENKIRAELEEKIRAEFAAKESAPKPIKKPTIARKKAA